MAKGRTTRAAIAPARPVSESVPPNVFRWPPALVTYLLGLQAHYRPADLAFPRNPVELADEARRNVFNADHISFIQVGHRGPWQSVKDQNGGGADTAGAAARWNLVFTRNMLRRQRNDAVARRRGAKRVALHNRRLGQIKGLVKGLDTIRPDRAEEILALLEAERAALPPLWHVRRDEQGRPRDGISVRPETVESRQVFWTPLVVGLFAYLSRTARLAGGAAQHEGRLFAMTAAILHHASEGAFPGGRQGARRTKQRYYRALDPAVPPSHYRRPR